MLQFIAQPDRPRSLRVLCIGAHCDDIEIGCAGTLATLQRRGASITIDWAILSGPKERRREAMHGRRLIVRPANRGLVAFGALPDGRFPAHYDDIKNFFEDLKRESRPDLVFCHERDDRHQDHRIVNEMTWNTFRDNVVLEYEIPKWDGGLGQPNIYVPLTSREAHAKAAALLKAYPSQAGKPWFKSETFMALLRLRGVECHASSGYAEAFHGRKLSFAGF